ncbi:MAG: 3D domain-containing protein [Pseudomonadales bacterium]|nr:3D domain-containing protein [Pseudomonadales bacterium]
MSVTLPLQRKVNVLGFTLVLVGMTWAASRCEAESAQVTMTVTATAYNSLYGQGAGADHSLAAWGDRLKPGMKAIAVSRDLIPLGLDHNTPVVIEGLDGVWYVKDKMHRRWKKKIDIYMGEDLQAARNWGRKKVTITFPAPGE